MTSTSALSCCCSSVHSPSPAGSLCSARLLSTCLRISVTTDRMPPACEASLAPRSCLRVSAASVRAGGLELLLAMPTSSPHPYPPLLAPPVRRVMFASLLGPRRPASPSPPVFSSACCAAFRSRLSDNSLAVSARLATAADRPSLCGAGGGSPPCECCAT
jgi:hypothetical protein